MSDHPPIDSFVFSLKAGEAARKDLDLKIDALSDRIDRIVKKVEIAGMPILMSLLGLTHDKSELELLGKALLRVAELMPELDELKKRKSILDLAASDPTWLAATFGDFSAEIDSLKIDDLE